MIKLRPYQSEAIETIRKTFEDYFRQYIQMPTGSGKTITFLSYAKKYHKNILIIVPSRELLKQVYETALKFYDPSEISRKGDRHNEKIKNVHICIVNSIRGDYLNFLYPKQFDLTIIDEAHHSQAESYKRFINKRSEVFHERDMRILGVTATPNRVDGQLLNDILHTCSLKLEIEDLINRKYLSDIEGYSVKTKIDLSDVDDRNGDFSLKLLYKKLCIESRNNLIVNLCENEMKDRKTLVFCINIEHSKQINDLLNKKKISSMHIDGKMDNTQRSSILSAFRNGEISTICNCQLLTEGFDEPSIDGIILARPTRSRSLFVQMVGRGLRIHPGKENCKVIDIVDNHKNLSGFNHLIDDVFYPQIQSFKSIKQIREHIGKESLKLTEFRIERTDFFNKKRIDDHDAVDCMIKYLQENQIKYFEPLSFDEGSFLIWHNELKKEFYNGLSRKKTT